MKIKRIVLITLVLLSCEDKDNTSITAEPSTEIKTFNKTNNDDFLFQYLFYEEDELIAKSLYVEESNRIKHKLFIRENGLFIIEPEFNMVSNFELYSKLNDLIVDKLKETRTINISKIEYQLNNRFSIDYLEELKHLYNEKQDDIYLKLIATGYKKIDDWGESSDNKCGGHCSIKENYVCVSPDPWDPGERAYCKKFTPVCKMNENAERINDAGLNSVFEQFSFFRDEFLLKSNFGTKYAQYYYALGAHLENDNISLSLVLETIQLLPLVSEKVDLLLDEGRFNESLLNETESNSILAILEKYKLESENNDYKNIIDNIINDVGVINGMSKIEFLDAIN